MNQRLFKALLISLVAFSLSGCFLHSEIVEAPPNSFSSEGCGECHFNEYEEWKESGHAKAWISEAFRKETDDYQVEKCLACHRAMPIYGTDKVTLRQEHAKEGVNCVTCHLTPDGEIGGPHFVLPAHYVKMSDPYFLESKLCGTCHEAHFEQWKATEKRLEAQGKELQTCQDCHMPAAYRKLIVKGIMQYAHWRMDTKKHTFDALPQAPAGEAPWFTATHQLLPKTERGLPISLRLSHRIPHGVPAGIFGFKAVDLIVSLKSASGQVIEEQQRVFHAENKDFIKAGETYEQVFTFSRSLLGRAEFFEVRLVRRDSRVSLGQQIFLQQNRI
ncbi:MAG: multiheme c-type cytochrome [bacterium]|nr:multiheme c-type cytochrome [bacterium]